jgi:negative regulator of flagellin synthesis FlgM
MGIELNTTNTRALQSGVEAGSKSQASSKAGGAGGNASTAKSASSQDEVALSGQYAQLHALEAEIANLPVVDTQRVQEVQHSISTGNYEIQPAEVADKLLTFEAGLGKPA